MAAAVTDGSHMEHILPKKPLSLDTTATGVEVAEDHDSDADLWAALAADLDFGCGSRESAGLIAAPDAATCAQIRATSEVASCADLTHDAFTQRFRHQKPVVLPGFASCWPALKRWHKAEALASLLDGHRTGESSPEVAGSRQDEATGPGEVLVLRSLCGHKFIKRDCVQEHRLFRDVVNDLFCDPQRASTAAAPAAAAAATAAVAALATAAAARQNEKGAAGPASVDDATRAEPTSSAPGTAAEGPQGRFYSRAPLASGLRADVDLTGLEALVGGSGGGEATGRVFKDSNCGVWLGSGGNVTPLHYDLCHGFLVQVIGVKTFTYFAPEDFRCMYQRPERPELSMVDLDCWKRTETGELSRGGGRGEPDEATVEAERTRYPRFADATARTVTLHPGDCLYTPPFWWHHVRTGDQPALSVLIPFDPLPEEPMHMSHFI